MQRATIKDIAAAVGVSHTTVSYVLNGNPHQKISDQTREKVLKAAKQLNYIPNETARSLRYDSTHCIVVALEKPITYSRFSNILQGIREECSSEGYGVLLLGFQSHNDQKNPAYLESVLRRSSDGVIYISSDGNPPDCCQSLLDNKIPFVGVDCCPEEEALSCVSFDYERGAFEIACRLLGEGARRILYWQPGAQTFQETYRIAGLNRALALYPDATLEVCKMQYSVDEPLSGDRNDLTGDMCQQSLVQDVLPRLASFGPNDAIICGWGAMIRYLCAFLYEKDYQKYKFALLSDAEIPLLPNIKILTSRPGFMKGGRESARILLTQIREGLSSVRVTLPPEPPTYREF